MASSLALSVISLPKLSTITTLSGVSKGTLEAIKCTMAWTCSGLTVRPDCGVTTTEALGGVRSRTKTDGLVMAKCTRAVCIVSICKMVRASSCSMAALYRACSMNWLVVKADCSFKASRPVGMVLGSPFDAKKIRAAW